MSETLEQYADRIVAAARKDMLDRIPDDVIGCIRESHLIFGKACAMKAVVVAMQEMQAGIDLDRGRTRYRHVKRGTEYTVIGAAELQMGSDLADGSTLLVYRGDDGKLWAREESEFHDGRFEPVAPTPATVAADRGGRDG